MPAKLTPQEKYMKAALREAKKAYLMDEVPIGCVIVRNDQIIARGYNRRNTDKNTLAHAELTAIRKASRKTGDWRLEDCTIYITLEPCQMCAGAIVQSRMKEAVIGAMTPKPDVQVRCSTCSRCSSSIIRCRLREEYWKKNALQC